MAHLSATPVQAEASCRIPDPAQLRDLSAPQLDRLAAGLRSFLIERVCATGGHLGPNLGAVELTLALHRVFDSPRDGLIFDTGHQAYVHKLLTGRAGRFGSLRQAGGLSGYPSRAESEHDLVENSHASTALSYADGLAKARQLSGEQERAVVAVIGDGALTGGMAWEALNNLGAARDRPVIVVLNDNGRSYEPTHGALAHHLHTLKSGKDAAACRNLFTDLGFTYFGPVDGHSTGDLEGVLRRARTLNQPVLVHVVTVKGKGYAPAEEDEADCLHAVGTVDPATGRSRGGGLPTWTTVFGRALAELAAERPDLVAITAAMLRPTGLYPMQQRFPERVFDVGIAEQHAVTSAAGLAMGGLHPVIALYATFLNRAFDQVLMDVALHRLPVTFVLDRAGITGPDGPSHHGMWDLSLLSTVPGLRVAAPRDAARVQELLGEAVAHGQGPTALRIPKATASRDIAALARMDGIDILHRSPHRPLEVLLVGAGPLAGAALDAAALLEEQGIGVTVADPRWVLPVNPALTALADRHDLAVSIEDGVLPGGLGWALDQACQTQAVSTPVEALGLPRSFIAHGPRTGLLAQAGLDAAGIARAVQAAHAPRPPATGSSFAAQEALR
ncbi:1-deoxy-D-xylulose-5-phosphate synthase [Streptomyces sp. DT2A-34]|uniref:1-deoxy-D-xylulose-5-phosphate synthase n=1 Tax=Streptomyces sp. DT2A-34 TaxID=3051182 RepID=UPI00265C6628|nr:1-deoxy-D-xylulose-5-phosphate synthase [Streptomyces sp. DT2A-34]MDO0917541.1 1-deoxy-D-xylulose-5-phosphate synthase [Streptomyces sp. DT2A-34]